MGLRHNLVQIQTVVGPLCPIPIRPSPMEIGHNETGTLRDSPMCRLPILSGACPFVSRLDIGLGDNRSGTHRASLALCSSLVSQAHGTKKLVPRKQGRLPPPTPRSPGTLPTERQRLTLVVSIGGLQDRVFTIRAYCETVFLPKRYRENKVQCMKEKKRRKKKEYSFFAPRRENKYSLCIKSKSPTVLGKTPCCHWKQAHRH